jgi:nickel-dependent lactate racemase
VLYSSLEFPEGGFDQLQFATALKAGLDRIGRRKRVLVIPPDITRRKSEAGTITSRIYSHYRSALAGVLPALGTHLPMSSAEISTMYEGVPSELFLVHDWRRDATSVGTIGAERMGELTGGLYPHPWTAQVNRALLEGNFDLILSVGQVVPHVVAGMANYNKNIFVGTGGLRSINISHYIGALCGVESIIGTRDNAFRAVLDYASANFTTHLPIVYVLTVIGELPDGTLQPRGLFMGDDRECFERAVDLSTRANVTALPRRPTKFVCYMDENEYHSTWLANKAVFRTRSAVADGGEILVIAPGVRLFGEDPEIDLLIRRHGYRSSENIRRAVDQDPQLAAMLGAAAHMMQSAPDGRFSVRYATARLSESELDGVGYGRAEPDSAMIRYSPLTRRPGFNRTEDGEEFYLVRNPAMGLWRVTS